VHQGLAVHGAGGNRTRTQRRRALSTRWAGDDIVYAPRPGMDVKLYDDTLAPGGPLNSPKFPLVLNTGDAA
jgi:ectoine hydroxylase-related dioxygenase (phytanoyl-CoA dioxygenase family)